MNLRSIMVENYLRPAVKMQNLELTEEASKQSQLRKIVAKQLRFLVFFLVLLLQAF